jgi:hypothetical protein
MNEKQVIFSSSFRVPTSYFPLWSLLSVFICVHLWLVLLSAWFSRNT